MKATKITRYKIVNKLLKKKFEELHNLQDIPKKNITPFVRKRLVDLSAYINFLLGYKKAIADLLGIDYDVTHGGVRFDITYEVLNIDKTATVQKMNQTNRGNYGKKEDK